MKRVGSNFTLGISLVIASAVVYSLQVLLFRRVDETFFYLFQDFAFVPVQVLLVTLVLNDFLSRREKADRQKKMNMVIGVFFNEVGTDLLKTLSDFDSRASDVADAVKVRADWTDTDFAKARKHLQVHEYTVDLVRDLTALKLMLIERRQFLLGLLENPNLLEHESFTELLWAVFHLSEELNHREDVAALHETDYAHLGGDMKRAYILLMSEWLAYLKHLKEDYPYIFSLVVRTNPFDPDAHVEIRQ